jgi:hypothetical protein
MDEQPPAAIDAAGPGLHDVPARGPMSYAASAIRIIKLDTEEMVRVSHDPMALLYGALVFVVTSILSVSVRALISGVFPSALTVAIAAFVAAFIGLIASVVTTGLVHLIAKGLFGTTGTLVRLLRVLWLGSIVSLLGIVPIVGGIVGGMWSLLITMVTFQEVDGIERLQALALSIGVSLGFFALGGLLSQYVRP